MRITVRVIPRSSKNLISREGDMLKVRLTAPPVDGAANDALLNLLAQRLNVSRRVLRIVQGSTARQKDIEIEEGAHLSQADIWQKLS